MSEDKTTQEENQTDINTAAQDTPETDNGPDTELPDELTTLKARAKAIGLTYHPNIGVDALREKINLKLRSKDLTDVKLEKGIPDPTQTEASEPAIDYSMEEIQQGYMQNDTSKMTKAQLRNHSIKEATRLVRIRLVCMNPNKRDWNGEIITVANSIVGTHRKFIPFGSSEPYHVPQIILQAIRERQCQIFVNGKNAQGTQVRKPTTINEFSVEVLPPLTEKEIKELAQRQAMANGTSE